MTPSAGSLSLVDALGAVGRGFEADRVASCGQEFRVGLCLNCGVNPAFPLTCDHRLCPSCASRRASRLIAEHEDMLRLIRYPKFVTLTFLSVPSIDKDYVKWMRKCFTKLRHRSLFRECWGGIYSFEFTYSERYGWHPHIHALLASPFLDQNELSSVWQSISGAPVVHIQSLKGDDKWEAVREVVKYPAKSASFLHSPALVDQFLAATQGVNLAYGFGALYRVRTKKRSDNAMTCPVCHQPSVSFDGGYGFYVPLAAIQGVKGGYLWRAPPDNAPGGS